MKSLLCAYYISWRRRWVYSGINYSTMNAIQWPRRTSWTFAKSCLAIRDIVILITNWKIIHNCPLQDKYTVIISQWRIFSLVELRTAHCTVLYCTVLYCVICVDLRCPNLYYISCSIESRLSQSATCRASLCWGVKAAAVVQVTVCPSLTQISQCIVLQLFWYPPNYTKHTMLAMCTHRYQQTKMYIFIYLYIK